MPRVKLSKWYAVRKGREGPQVYETWGECELVVHRYPNAEYKGFMTCEEAMEWILPALRGADAPSHLPQLEPGPSSPSKSVRALAVENATCMAAEMGQHAPAGPNAVKLSDEQQYVVDLVKQGNNVFFTGSAGTGKSVCLREIIRALRQSGAQGVFVTASTGIAAVNIEGSTIHSFAGIGFGQEDVGVLLRKVSMVAKERWRKTRVLVIDEISMVDGKLFDTLEYLARKIRRIDAPFGEIQLVICGDFFQLPPVVKNGDRMVFAFDAFTWRKCIHKQVTLTKVFRQKESEFVTILNELRVGKVSEAATKKLMSLSQPVQYHDGIEPTAIFSKRAEVERANQARLKQLPGEEASYKALDYPGYDSKGHPTPHQRMVQLLDQTRAVPLLTLRVGAQVMLIKNMGNTGLVNGSLGVIQSFENHAQMNLHAAQRGEVQRHKEMTEPQPPLLPQTRYPVVLFSNGQQMLCAPAPVEVLNGKGEVEATRDQVPLILAWALSVHKSQGQTIDRVKVDLGSVFEKGQAYVALSRATSLETLEVVNFQPSRVMAHPRVITWTKTLYEHGRAYTPEEDELDYDLELTRAMAQHG